MAKVAWVNERGTLTLPKEIRREIPWLDGVRVSYENGKIILDPLQTSDEFIEEIERRSREAKTGKNYTIDEVDAIMEQHYAKKKV